MSKHFIVPTQVPSMGSVPLIALDPKILDRFGQDLHGCSFAGDPRHAKLLFLALYTQLLDRPVSVVVKGLSSSGKSFLLKTALRFFPNAAYVEVTGMSEKALVYWNVDLCHKHLVVTEFSGLQNNDAGNWLLRNLLSEGCVRYSVVVNNEGKNETKEFTKEGPTGLLTTTTLSNLYTDDSNRMLAITVDDDGEHIGYILEAAAQMDVAVTATNPPDFREWHALYEFVRSQPTKAQIPFALKLARLIKSKEARMTRDFEAVKSLMKAHALIHQTNRRKHGKGYVIVELEDYRAVHGLVADILAEGSNASVSAKVRETVEAVQALSRPRDIGQQTLEDLGGITLQRVAQKLSLSESATSRRVNEAIEKSYLRNAGSGPGKPMALVVDRPLPKDSGVLPTPEELEAELEAELAGPEAA